MNHFFPIGHTEFKTQTSQKFKFYEVKCKFTFTLTATCKIGFDNHIIFPIKESCSCVLHMVHIAVKVLIIINSHIIQKKKYYNSFNFQIIDNYAFKVYGHWVKKGEGQDRAALFQNYPKIDRRRMEEVGLSSNVALLSQA